MPQLPNRLSIRIQVIIPVLIALTFLSAGVLLSSSKIKSAFQSVSTATTETITYKDNLTNIVDNIYGMRISAIYSLFKPSELHTLPLVLKKNQQTNLKLLNQIDQLEGVHQEVEGLRSAMNNYVDYSLNTMLPLLKQKHSSISHSQIFHQEYASASDTYRQYGKAMVNAIRALSEKLNESSLHALHYHEGVHTSALDYSVIGLIFVLLAAVLVCWLMSGWIVKPIRHLQSVMHRVAEGNLTTFASVQGDNEVSHLAKDINLTISQLKTTVDSLTRISSDVASAATELATVMTQSSVNSDQERNEIEQVSSAIAQLEVAANSVTESAQHADTSASKANQLVGDSISMFEQSNQASQAMTTQLESAASVIDTLKEQSDKIGNFIEVIEGISEQTNLLALNAAIEAARAGESGRGFSVVADEVRMLASRTQESTQEIQSIISKLQQQSISATQSMGLTLSALQQNSSISMDVKDVLSDIADSITELSSMNTQVATASEEQRQVTAEISRNITNIYELVNQNVSGITQSATASHELSALAEQQNHKLNEFKIA